jgi:transposase-like protein
MPEFKVQVGAMGGADMNCPECSSGRVELLLVMRDDRLDDRGLTMSKFRCQSCGFQFETREHWEIRKVV